MWNNKSKNDQKPLFYPTLNIAERKPRQNMTVTELMNELNRIDAIFERDMANDLGVDDIPMLVDFLVKYKQELLHKKVV